VHLLPSLGQGGIHRIARREPRVEGAAEGDCRPVGDGELHGDHGGHAAEHQGARDTCESIGLLLVDRPRERGRFASVEDDEPQEGKSASVFTRSAPRTGAASPSSVSK